MEREDVVKRVMRLVRAQTHRSIAVTEASAFADLAWDSLSCIDFAVSLEDEFDMVVTAADRFDMECIQGTVDHVMRKVAPAAAPESAIAA